MTRLVAERVVSIYAAIHTAHRWLVVGSLSFSEGSQASTAFGGKNRHAVNPLVSCRSGTVPHALVAFARLDPAHRVEDRVRY